MRSRLHIGHFERFDIGSMFQNRAELLGEPVNLILGQLKARQTGYMDHLIAGQAFSHGAQG